MKTTLSFIIFALSLLLPFSSAQAENLTQIYKLSLQNDPQFQAAAAEQKAIEETRSQSLAPLLPQLNLTAHTTDNSQEVKSSSSSLFTVGKSDYDTSGYTLSLKQAIYHHDYYVQLRQADAQVAQAAANYRTAEQDLIVRVAERYFQFLGALDNLAFARAEKRAISQQLNQTKQRFKVGLTAITDVHEAQARYDQAVAQTINAENLLAVTRENLRELTGQAHNQLSPLNEQSPLIPPDPQDLDRWVETALQQSAPLIVAEKAMDIALEEINRNRAGHYPTLDLVADKTYTDTTGGSFGARETDDVTVSLQLNIPLYSGGLVSSQTREAAFRHQQARQQYELQRRTTERLTRSSYLNVIANISQVQAFKQALASSRTALEATQAGFEVGTRTAVDVLDSQRELFRAERDYAQSRYTYILETFRLKQAAGILTENDLKQVNTWLQ